jgi:hypothetical protein
VKAPALGDMRHRIGPSFHFKAMPLYRPKEEAQVDRAEVGHGE